MTKHYIAPKDKVLLTDQKYNGSTWESYASTDAGKIAKVMETTTGSGIYNLQLVDGGTTSVAWTDVTSKPFSSIGAGLTVTSDALTADTQLHFEIFTTLPTASSTYSQTIGLIAMSSGGVTQNTYKEYACVKTADTPETWAWELLGAVEASVSQTTSEITINGTVINTASSSQIGLLSSTDWGTFNGKQDAVSAGTAGEVLTNSGTEGQFGTSIGFDTEPTASSTNLVKSGAIKTALELKQTTDNLVTAFQATPDNTHYPSELLVSTSLAGKQDKITASTTAGVPEAIVTTDTAGSVAKRAICTDLTQSTVTTATTDFPTAGAVKAYSAPHDSTSTVTYKVGCDSTGPYIDY